MRIVIDLQGAQSTGSRTRGIGRYTQSLTLALARQRGEHQIFLLLNEAFADAIAPIRAQFAGLLPPEHIHVWGAPGPASSAEPANRWRRQTAELLREAALASLRPDVILVTSLFEGLSDSAVTSVALLQQQVPTAVILYDLIPLIQRQPYLDNPVVESWYESKLEHLRRADLLLAISASSRQEAIDHLGFDQHACVNISTAADGHFAPLTVAAGRAEDLRARLGLHQPFLMYTGGIDLRKNIEGLICAYATLAPALRLSHQLVIVCAVQPHSRAKLEQLCREQGLAAGEVVLTGYVSEDDLLALYNLCKAFVFPSWHEGFGLPALEAMSCGRAVIAADSSSLPEVIGRADAMFDPHSRTAMADKLAQVLTDTAFRQALEQHGLAQARRFTWDDSARRALAAMERLHARQLAGTVATLPRCQPQRPRLAYVSPLPPERSGIADYSAELLPELARHYRIDIITPQANVGDPWARANCVLRSPEWLRAHALEYDRVLYHFGNSHFHQHMFGLLEDIPGVVVLHDFFLSGVAAHMETSGYQPRFWARALYASHGYHALAERCQAADTAEIVYRYPACLPVLRGALGVIVHSESSRRLASSWYGAAAAADWKVIPHLRRPEQAYSRAEARRLLGLQDDDVLVCSFGLLGPTKLNDRLLNAWLASALAAQLRCRLVFVGENDQGRYGAALQARIDGSGAGARIAITGWTDSALFRQWLAAADIGVQLRTLSRGETSGTVLDCMNYGLATIVNANGSMADLDDDGVIKLADQFDDAALVAALERLLDDLAYRQQLGQRARALIVRDHAPRLCADRYASAIEGHYSAAVHRAPHITSALAGIDAQPLDRREWIGLAQALADSVPPACPERQLLIDVSGVLAGVRSVDAPLGRRGPLRALLRQPPPGWRVEPVYASAGRGYCYARRFTLKLLGCPVLLADDCIEYLAGDVFIAAEGADAAASDPSSLQRLRAHGVLIELIDAPAPDAEMAPAAAGIAS